jgi:hypothetical protein
MLHAVLHAWYCTCFMLLQPAGICCVPLEKENFVRLQTRLSGEFGSKKIRSYVSNRFGSEPPRRLGLPHSASRQWPTRKTNRGARRSFPPLPPAPCPLTHGGPSTRPTVRPPWRLRRRLASVHRCGVSYPASFANPSTLSLFKPSIMAEGGDEVGALKARIETMKSEQASAIKGIQSEGAVSLPYRTGHGVLGVVGPQLGACTMT